MYRTKQIVVDARHYNGGNLSQIKTFMSIRDAEFDEVTRRIFIPEEKRFDKSKSILSKGEMIVEMTPGKFLAMTQEEFYNGFEEIPEAHDAKSESDQDLDN